MLNEEVDIIYLLTDYSIEVSLLSELYDDCYKKLDDDGSGTVLIFDHGFHWHCYD